MDAIDFAIEELFAWPHPEPRAMVTSDGHVAAFTDVDGGSAMCFGWDGRLGEPFTSILPLRNDRPATFASPDGAHIAYAASREGRFFVGRDDREDPAIVMFSRSVPPTFDHAGRHLVYGGAVVEGETRLIVDGQPAGNTELAPVAAVLSPDGDRLAYVEMQLDGREPLHRIVLDGTPGDWFRGMRNAQGAMQFSPDGSRFAFYAIDGKGGARWTVDGRPQRSVNDGRPIGLAQVRGVGVLDPPLPARFSPDGRRFAYFADVVEKGVAVLEDDVPGPLVKATGWPTFSADSRRLAYAAQQMDKSWTLVVDGVASGSWQSASWLPVVSPDSRRVALAVSRSEGGLFGKKHLFAVAVDGDPLPFEVADDAAMRPVWSHDGSRLAWWIARGKANLLVVDGVVQTAAPRLVSDIQSDASGRFIYVGDTGGGHTVIVDGRPGPLAEFAVELRPAHEVLGEQLNSPPPVPFRTSPDGRHVAWAAFIDGQCRPVLDDAIGPSFDDVFECRFEPDGTAVWWGIRVGKVCLTRATP